MDSQAAVKVIKDTFKDSFDKGRFINLSKNLVKLSARRIFIVETKGQEDLDVPLKMQRLRQWCEDINRVQADVEYGFVYVDQESFEKYKPASFRQLVDGFREYKEKI